MPSASSSAPEADEGAGAPGGFPFVVLSGGGDSGKSVVHPAFAAYARRSVAPGRTARDALAMALAEASNGGSGVDEASYGVTRSPFAHVSSAPAPVDMPARLPVEPPIENKAVPDVSTVKLARRRPVLRESTSADANVVDAPVETRAENIVMPEVEMAPPPASPTLAESAPSSAASEVLPTQEPLTEPATTKLKISTRRAGQSTAPIPGGAPPPDSPFLTGPAMDGTRSPLMPLPILSNENGGVFVPPANPMTRAPFPVPATAAPFPFPLAGGVSAGTESAGLAPLMGAKPAQTPPVAEVVEAAEPSDLMGELAVWTGRLVVLGVVLAFFGLVGYFWKQSPYWPFRMKHIEVTSTPLYHDDSGAANVPAVAVGGTGESTPTVPVASPVPAVPPPVAPVVAQPTPVAPPAPAEPPTPVRPQPTLAFVNLVGRLKITGVLQGEPVRAIIDGRLVQAGDLVDVGREVRLVGLDLAKRELLFEDRTTARATVRY